MKQLILTLTFILTFFCGYSQYVAENGVLKIESIGWNGLNYVVKLTNKANCETNFRINYTVGTKDTLLPANASAYVTLVGMNPLATEIKAKKIGGAACVNGTNTDWVLVLVLQTALPIKFKSISAKKVDEKTIRLEFESEEDNTIDRYRIKISSDGKYWKDVLIIFPNGIQGSKKYSVIVNL